MLLLQWYGTTYELTIVLVTHDPRVGQLDWANAEQIGILVLSPAATHNLGLTSVLVS